MKKLLIFLVLMIGMIFPIMAQDGGTTTNGFMDYFATLTALAGLNVIIVAAVLKFFKTEPTKLVKQLIAIGIALILCVVGWFMQWGIFTGTDWWMILVYTVGVAFPSNGFFDIIKALILSMAKKK